ncbi:MAG: histidinol-phosphate transaminase [Actinobacteria bacterium]|nr:histidinol-phosphate transaminase [Actinomycetota bacterium]
MRANPWIFNLPEYVPGKTIEEVKKKYNLKTVYKLASNENIWGPAPQVLKCIEKTVNEINYYPDSYCRDLKEKLSLKYNVSPDNIIVGNGTDEIIGFIADCFICIGQNAVVFDPTFSTYEKSVLKCGGKVIKVPLENLRQNVVSMVDAIDTKTKIIFLTNPHNPTGTNITEDEFKSLVKDVSGDILIVVDEAYYEYMPPEDRVDTLNYVRKHDNLIILRTFSKIYGLAGLRIGYGISSSKVISALNRVRLPFNVNSMAQKAALVALENDSYVEEIRKKVIAEKEKFYKVLKNCGIEFIESYANFVCIKVGDKTKKIVEELLKKGFIVRPGENLGLPGYIRVTISLPEINDMFLEAFTRIYRNVVEHAYIKDV